MNAAKPFVCPAIGCNQQFANEDHLEVHRRKHEMSLGLRDFKSSLDTPVIADQTPTPTRFLKNCEEVGLFSDLPNPFDAEFRKASELHQHDSEANNNENNEENETEKTADNDNIEPTSIATVGDTSSTTITASPQAVSSTTQEEEVASAATLAQQVLTTTSAPSYSIPVTITKAVPDVAEHVEQPQEPQHIEAHRAVTIHQPVTSGQSVVTQVAVQGSAAAAVPVSVVPAAVAAAARMAVASGEAKVSIANVNMPLLNTIPISAPILLRLPTGQTIPVVPPGVANPAVQIPLAVSAVAESQATQSQASDAAPTVSEGNVKMKLKNALLTSQSQGNMGVMTQAVEVVTRQQQAVTSTSIALPQKTEFTVTQVSPGRRRKSQDMDGDEKRRRFLERNRAAATRCRNKRKQWIQNLEEKADDLNNTNNRLQNEVTSLRNEVAQLKQLLLAHKDCPVTIMQRKSQGQILPGSSAAGESECMEVSTGATSVVHQQMATVITTQIQQDMS